MTSQDNMAFLKMPSESGEIRGRLARACALFGLLDYLLVMLLAMLIMRPVELPKDETEGLIVQDRPVLETVQQVYQAQTTDTCAFYFDGVYYVIHRLPKGYVDYSSWYVRMP